MLDSKQVMLSFIVIFLLKKDIIMKFLLRTAIFILATTSSFSYAGNFFEDLNKTLGSVNQVLGAVNGNSTASSPTYEATPMAQATNVQIQKIAESLDVDTKNPEINQALFEARKNIAQLLLVGSCQTDMGQPRIGHILSPSASSINLSTSMKSTNYHPKSQCLTVSSIGEWNMPAKNALKFTVIYYSEVSGESVKRYVELVKTTNQWLVTKHDYLKS